MSIPSATLAVLFIGTWAYGIYSTVQVYRHLKPGTRIFRDVMMNGHVWYQLDKHVTNEGLQFMRRALWSVLVAVFTLALLVNVMTR